jgi:hypothetical protein
MGAPVDAMSFREGAKILLGRSYGFTTFGQAALDYLEMERKRVRLMIDLRGKDRLEISLRGYDTDPKINEVTAILTNEKSIADNLTPAQRAQINMPDPAVMNQQYNFLTNEVKGPKVETFFRTTDSGRVMVSTGY